MLQIDGQIVGANSYFSNKEGKKLIVYYMPADAEVTPAPTDAPVNNYTPTPTQAPVVQQTDPPYVEPETTPPAPVQQETPPPQPPADENPGNDQNGESGNSGGDSQEFGMW